MNAAPKRGLERQDGENAGGCLPRAAVNDHDRPRPRHRLVLCASALAAGRKRALVSLGLGSISKSLGYRSRANHAGFDPKVM